MERNGHHEHDENDDHMEMFVMAALATKLVLHVVVLPVLMRQSDEYHCR